MRLRAICSSSIDSRRGIIELVGKLQLSAVAFVFRRVVCQLVYNNVRNISKFMDDDVYICYAGLGQTH